MKAIWLWALYALFVVYATTLPFRFEPSPSIALEKLAHLPLSVMTGASGRRASIPDMVQNVLLFVPFGALGALALSGWAPRTRGARAGRSPRRVASRWLWVTAAGTMLSVSVEILQLFTTDRVSSLNDVLTNTMGAALGGLGVAALAVVAGRTAWLIDALPAMGPSLRTTMTALGVLAVAAWHPFDASLDVGGFVSKVRALIAQPWQAGTPDDLGVDFLRYALFAGATAVWLRDARVRRPRIAAAGVAAAAAIALELSQFIIGARMPGLKDMAVGAAGGAVGALVGPRLRASRTPAAAAGVVIAAAWLATALMVLAPYTVASESRPIGWIPFLGYYQYTSGQTVSHVLELAMAFFPIGFALTWISPRFVRWPATAAAALVMAAPLEYMQGWIVGRYPDVTDVMVMTLGALLGGYAAVRTRNLDPET